MPRTTVEDLRSWTVAVGASAQIQPSTTATQGRSYDEIGVSVLVPRMQIHAPLFKCLTHVIVVVSVGLLKSKKLSMCQALLVLEQDQGLEAHDQDLAALERISLVVVVRETN